MAVTHVGYIRFAGESGLEGLIDEYVWPGLEHKGYRLLHTEHMPANFVAGNGISYEYTTQVGDGENWIIVDSILPI